MRVYCSAHQECDQVQQVFQHVSNFKVVLEKGVVCVIDKMGSVLGTKDWLVEVSFQKLPLFAYLFRIQFFLYNCEYRYGSCLVRFLSYFFSPSTSPFPLKSPILQYFYLKCVPFLSLSRMDMRQTQRK